MDSSKSINTAEAAIATLNSSDDDGLRYYAAWWLGKHRISEACPLLCDCLKDDRYRTTLGGYPLRRQAARSLGFLKDHQATPALIKSLKCPDYKLQEAVILAMKDIGDSTAISALLDFFFAEEAEKPYEALIETFATFQVWEIKDQIKPFLQHTSERVKGAAALYFYSLTLEPYYLQMLLQNLDHKNRFLRLAAAFDLAALSQVETAPAIVQAQISNNIKLAVLKRMLESSLHNQHQKDVQRIELINFLFHAIDGLLLDAIEGNISRSNTEGSRHEAEKITDLLARSQIASEQEFKSLNHVLIEAVKSVHPNVKTAAIKGLVQLAPASTDAIIQALDSDPDQDLKAGLTQALVAIADPRTFLVLDKVIGIEIATHCQGKIRRVATRGLGKIGRVSRDPAIIEKIVEKLTWILHNPDDWALRYSAVVSLEEIGDSETIGILALAADSEADLIVQARTKRALAVIS